MYETIKKGGLGTSLNAVHPSYMQSEESKMFLAVPHTALMTNTREKKKKKKMYSLHLYFFFDVTQASHRRFLVSVRLLFQLEKIWKSF